MKAKEIIDLTTDDSEFMVESHDNLLESQIKLDIQAESFAIDDHNKNRKKSKRRTKANNNSTSNVDHQFIEVTFFLKIAVDHHQQHQAQT